MSSPEPMLSCSARGWPEGGEWVLQPKWDGFRLNWALLHRTRLGVWLAGRRSKLEG